jgi:type IV pilus assembly protein PilK
LSRQLSAPAQKTDSFEMWSVGCSTGEESYALAAIANDCFEAAGVAPYFGVTAADISLPALSIARQGIYCRRSLNLLVNNELIRYFTRQGKDKYKIADKIKKRVCFSQINIAQLQHKLVQPMDVIFCQNVLIYFRRWRRREILKQLVKHLKLGGIIVIGLGELTEWRHDQLQRIDSSEVQAYKKIA